MPSVLGPVQRDSEYGNRWCTLCNGTARAALITCQRARRFRCSRPHSTAPTQVCGVDGKTYSSSCVAGNCGINPVKIACEGECPCAPTNPKDCCPKGTYCCGDGCVDDDVRFVQACKLGTCGCDAPPPPPPDECCPADKPVCCGSGCITKQQATVSLCLECSRAACVDPPPSDECCPVDKPVCCGSSCITKAQAEYTRCMQCSRPGCADPPPDGECCPAKTPVCCGDGCITKEDAVVSLCPRCSRESCLTPAPEPENCCSSGHKCCGSRCISDKRYHHKERRGLCPDSAEGCCPTTD